MSAGDNLAKLSLNQKTVNSCSVPEVVELCRDTGIGSVGLWREPVAEYGVQATVELIRDAGLRVSSLCRGGWFTAAIGLRSMKRLHWRPTASAWSSADCPRARRIFSALGSRSPAHSRSSCRTRASAA